MGAVYLAVIGGSDDPGLMCIMLLYVGPSLGDL